MSTTAGAPKKPKTLSAAQRLCVALLIIGPLALIAYKCSHLPGAESAARALSLTGLEGHDLTRANHLLAAPIGALIVVFCRVTLGMRVLGPFRSLLLALAFQVTGPLVGLGFFAIVVCAVVVLRPKIKRLKMPFYGRSASLLVCVAGTIVAAMMLGLALGISEVVRVAYFPVVVLTLTGEAFGGALRREGWKSAVWRACITAGVALVITGVTALEGLRTSMVRFPELVLLCLGCVVIVSRTMKLRLLQGLNPPPVKKSKKKKAPGAEARKADSPTTEPAHEDRRPHEEKPGDQSCVSAL